jgi:signal transduction histidine kinase
MQSEHQDPQSNDVRAHALEDALAELAELKRAFSEQGAGFQAALAAARTADAERMLVVRQLLTAQEDERLRIARDLHDQLGQQITAMQLGLKRLELHARGTSVAEMLPALQQLAQQMAIDSHRFAVDLRPTTLDDMGLAPALERLLDDWSAQTRVRAAFQRVGLEQRLPRHIETALYRIIQEALTNIRKYAEASNVAVVTEQRGAQVVAIIEDNGRGFDVNARPAPGARPQLGLVGMRERATLLGGTLEIESSPGNGTTVFVRVPLDTPAEEHAS